MSSTAQDVTKMITMIELHFPLAKFIDEATESAWTASMVKFLSPYEPDVLARAAEYIIQTRDGSKRDTKFFPSPSEIISTCETFKVVCAAEKNKDTPLLSHGERDRSEFASWRKDRADELINSEMGRVAAKQGWIGALWGFVRFGGLKWDRWGRRIEAKPDTPRLPTVDEIAALKTQAKEFDEALETCERGDAGPNSRTLAELGRKIKARRDEKADLANGGLASNG